MKAVNHSHELLHKTEQQLPTTRHASLEPLQPKDPEDMLHAGAKELEPISEYEKSKLQGFLSNRRSFTKR